MRKGGRRYSSPQSPGIRRVAAERLVDERLVVVVEGEGEEGRVVGPVLALAEPRADDDRRDGGLLEHPAGRDVGDGDAVLARDRREGPEKTLQDGPAADRVDEALVFRLAPVLDAKPAPARPTQRSVRKPPPSVP